MICMFFPHYVLSETDEFYISFSLPLWMFNMFMPVMMQPLRKVAPGESGEKPDKPEDDGKARNILSPVGEDKIHGNEVS